MVGGKQRIFLASKEGVVMNTQGSIPFPFLLDKTDKVYNGCYVYYNCLVHWPSGLLPALVQEAWGSNLGMDQDQCRSG